ncbi:MAG TPA: methyltransferase [Candidatus Deferrimicrobium sp.]|nr:methyltransferase [Candidatus Deferrimicrobium sp.]
MKIKGIDKFREKLPALHGKRIILVPIYTITCVILIFFILFWFLHLSTEVNVQFAGINWNWIFPILGVVIIEVVGLVLVYQMWYWRDRLKQKYQQTSYQRIFFVGFAGILCMICLGIFNIIPLLFIQPYLSSVPSVAVFVQQISQFWFTATHIFDLIRVIIGITVCAIGFGTMFRSMFTFGFDYMTVVYLYFPEESAIQNNKIYSVLRHPTYAALIYVSFAGILIQFSLYSIIFFVLYLIGFEIHIHKVEDKELIQRFGESFENYRKQVPAILVPPRHWKTFLKFLVGKK